MHSALLMLFLAMTLMSLVSGHLIPRHHHQLKRRDVAPEKTDRNCFFTPAQCLLNTIVFDRALMTQTGYTNLKRIERLPNNLPTTNWKRWSRNALLFV